jgi:hypothetical protein
MDKRYTKSLLANLNFAFSYTMLQLASVFINSISLKAVPIYKQCKSKRVKKTFNCKQTVEIVRLHKDVD